MKRLRLIQNSTKRGVASIYVVVFATILFGIVTLSFARIILSESSQSSNDDLSRSAYDAALAGVEDAKIMVNKYYECIKSGSTAGCEAYNIFNDTNCEDGFALADKLHNITPNDTNPGGEVLIQESSGTVTDTAADQAYTCVLVSDITPDYRSTLSSDTRTKAVPISINGSGSTNEQLPNLGKIRLSWYSDLNQGSTSNTFNLASKNSDSVPQFPNAASKTIPPTVQLTFIKTGSKININDFRSANNTAEVIYSAMLFVPTGEDTTGTAKTTVSTDELRKAGNAVEGGKTNQHNPFSVDCSKNREFACIVELDVSGLNLKEEDNIMIVVSLPYGDAFTDFAVQLLAKTATGSSEENVISFKGAQISVDSTGRTNQLYRRVEARLDPADLFFPYPQYALELNGSDEDSIKKYFWVTANCWTEEGACANNGSF